MRITLLLLLMLALLIGIFSATVASAATIALAYQGKTLEAELTEPAPLTSDQPVFLLVHGTLAHNKMELITQLQTLLEDEGYSSLAINLSLGQNKRSGMYDCATPHQHKHSNATKEINAWVNWLQRQGATHIMLIGHSRGGNQSAQFSQRYPKHIQGQILLAPATWNAKQAADDYQKRYHTPLADLLAKAKTASPDSWLESTGFIYCENAKVMAGSFLDYYLPNPQLDTPHLLKSTQVPTLVISGSEDSTVSDLPARLTEVENPHVSHYPVEGADHFFRDLYMDEVVEALLEFTGQQP